jgi:hypothetical protein
MDTEFYCPNKVLGYGTLCKNGYPFVKQFPNCGETPKYEFNSPAMPCRAWQEACPECKIDCQYYQEEDPEDCIAKNGYCKVIERMSGGFDEW